MYLYLLPILNILCSTFLIYGPELYIQTNKSIYIVLTIISTNLLIYILYKMLSLKYTILTTTLCGKIIPMIFLSLIGFFVVKDQKITSAKILGLFLVIIGTYILLKY